VTGRIICGDALTILRTLPDESVHCVVTSPPYWDLRDYGTGQWEGGRAECDHKKEAVKNRGDDFRKRGEANGYNPGSNFTNYGDRNATASDFEQVCGKCGARRIDAQLGLEPTPELYVEHMVEVFREIRRVLRGDGTLWLNLGDSYAGSWGTRGHRETPATMSRHQIANHPKRASHTGTIHEAGMKPKDLVGIPWRVAFALQADGWYLRSDIIWHKPNPMPESVRDRPTKAHEYVFLLSKSARYYYDAEAIREITGCEATPEEYEEARKETWPSGGIGQHAGAYKNDHAPALTHPNGRNARTVWTVATQAFSGAHFATFPEELARRCIAAGTSARGCCPECGAPWRRVVERHGYQESTSGNHHSTPMKGHSDDGKHLAAGLTASGFIPGRAPIIKDIGWAPTCFHTIDPVPCTVLDPFGGAGTVGLVAQGLGREYLLIELKPEYVEMARARIHDEAPLFADLGEGKMENG
jgi:DNA modification methylase